MTTLLSLLAQTTQTTGDGGGSMFLRGIMPFVLIFVIFYLFIIRPKQNQAKEQSRMQDKLKPGQRVQTIGGMMGVIHSVTDREVTVKVDETNNVKIKFVRAAIHRVYDEDKDKDKGEQK